MHDFGEIINIFMRFCLADRLSPDDLNSLIDLVAALGELLRGAGDAAVVLVSGAVAAGLAGDGDTGESAAAPAMTRWRSL